MSTTIALPEELYARLSTLARERGESPEHLLRQLVEEAIERNTPRGQDERASSTPIHDPVAKFIGAFTFGVGDLAENHDRYLAEAHADRHDSSG